MAKEFSRIDESLKDFIGDQAVFFVATAPSDGGRINLSPKGYRDTFAVLDDRTIAYLDLFGSGVEFPGLLAHFGGQHAGIRAAIVVDLERIADACGFAVAYYELVDERPVLDAHHDKASDDAYVRLADRNRHSIDGLPALEADHPLPRSRA